MRLPFWFGSFLVWFLSGLSEGVYDSRGMLYNIEKVINIEDIIYRRNRINRQGETNVRNRGNLRSTA